MPPAANISPPGESGGPLPPSVTMTAPPRTVLGLTWTWMAESVDNSGQPTLADAARPGEFIHPEISMTLRTSSDPGSDVTPLLTDDSFSFAYALPGDGLVLADGENLHYRAQFRLPDLQEESSLLTTPVLDDVTIYYKDFAFLVYYIE